MKCFDGMPRVAGLVLAAVVVSLTLAVMVHATQVITTPNAASFTYSLAASASSAAITPPADTPVLVVGDQTTAGNVGSSLLTLVSSTTSSELVWNGFESRGGGLTSGFTGAPGVHMVFIDLSHGVDLQVNNATSFKVVNSLGATQKGKVIMIW